MDQICDQTNFRMTVERSEPLVLVRDVRSGVAWYCRLFDCQADHGLEEFDPLTVGGEGLLMLHRGDAAERGASLDSRVVSNDFVLWVDVDALRHCLSARQGDRGCDCRGTA